jgi:hypothetical protein
MGQFYNHDWKERYFDARENEYQSIRLIGRTFFNITKPFEEELNKDCSNFTVKEILNMYSACLTRSWEQLLNFNSQLKIYTNWCLKENLVKDNQNHYAELGKEEIYQCLNLGLKEKMVITRDELEKMVKSDEIPNPSDQFLCLAFFEGLGGLGYKDFLNLMPNQFVKDKVILSDRELIVSKLLIAKALESADTYDKFSKEKKLKVGYSKTDPSVVKDSSNCYSELTPERNIKKMHRRIERLEKEYGKAYGYVGLKNSGRIDMINRLIMQDNNNDVRQVYEKHKEDIEYRYGKLQRIFRWLEENKQFFVNPS